MLDSSGRINGFVDAWKHRQKPVPGHLEDASAMPRDCGFDQIIEDRAQLFIGGGLVFGHHQAVADYVGGHDRGELAFHQRFPRSQAQTGIADI